MFIRVKHCCHKRGARGTDTEKYHLFSNDKKLCENKEVVMLWTWWSGTLKSWSEGLRGWEGTGLHSVEHFYRNEELGSCSKVGW